MLITLIEYIVFWMHQWNFTVWKRNQRGQDLFKCRLRSAAEVTILMTTIQKMFQSDW